MALIAVALMEIAQCAHMGEEIYRLLSSTLQRVMNAANATRLQPRVMGPCHTRIDGAALVANSRSTAV